jgi:hypothetical protein
MHDCPRCGQPCTCSGDIDDTYVLKESWVLLHCQCECEDFDEDEEHYDWWDNGHFHVDTITKQVWGLHPDPPTDTNVHIGGMGESFSEGDG